MENPYLPPVSPGDPPLPPPRRRWFAVWCLIHLVIAPVVVMAMWRHSGDDSFWIACLAVIIGFLHARWAVTKAIPRRQQIISGCVVLQSILLGVLLYSAWIHMIYSV